MTATEMTATELLTALAGREPSGLAYLDAYYDELAHQAACEGDPLYRRLLFNLHGVPQPNRMCMSCALAGRLAPGDPHDKVARSFAWAVPSRAALTAIVDVAPAGVVEVGAGGGYWAYELQRAGADVIAYDPAPPGMDPMEGYHPWHDGRAWTAVHRGDHTAAAQHPTRALLLVWPSYDAPWGAEAVQGYADAGGQTVIYVGEGPSGCTGDSRLHWLLGLEDEPHDWRCERGACECPPWEEQLFRPEREVAIPQWQGIHDALYVCTRAAS